MPGVAASLAELAALNVLIDEHGGRILTMAYLRGAGADGFLSAIESGLIEKHRDRNPALDPWGPFSLRPTPRGLEAHQHQAARKAIADQPVPVAVPVAEPAAELEVLPPALEATEQSEQRPVTAEDLDTLTWKADVYGNLGRGGYLQIHRCVEHPVLTRTVIGSTRARTKPSEITYMVDKEPIDATKRAMATALTAFYRGELVHTPQPPPARPARPKPPPQPTLF